MSDKVWTDDEFVSELSEHNAAHKNDWNAALELGRKMLKAWQADHDDLTAKLDEKDARIAELNKQLAVYVWEEIDHQEFLSPLVKQDELRERYKQLTGRDYDESEGSDDE